MDTIATVVHLAASMAAICLAGVESLASFVSSDDFTAAYLVILLIKFILGQRYEDALSVDTRNQEALERALEDLLEGREGEHCEATTRVSVTTRKSRRTTRTTIDRAMVSASGQCSICLQEFKEGQIGELMPECHHLFHPLCIDEWLVTHTTCPLCRSLVCCA